MRLPRLENERIAETPARVATSVARAARWFWRGLVKVIATTWRFARALDSALWRGVRYGATMSLRAAGEGVRTVGGYFADLVGWLPSRAGRAYTALSGAVLIIAALWILDELRVAPTGQSALAEGILRPPASEGDPIVARIDGRYVHLSEVRASAIAAGDISDADRLTVKAAFERRLVEAYVNQKLLSRAAVESGVQKKPDVARQILAARDRILAASFMQDRLAQSVTDAAARRIYNAQADATRGGEEVESRIIVVASEADALSVVEALGQGADFAALARSLSIDRESGERGGALGWITRDYKDSAVAAIAFSTATGVRAAPFQTDAGWCVLETTGRRRVGGVAFEDVRDDVKRYLRMKAIDATLAGLKEDSEVVFYPTEPARGR